jgi:hypothetical protein
VCPRCRDAVTGWARAASGAGNRSGGDRGGGGGGGEAGGGWKASMADGTILL